MTFDVIGDAITLAKAEGNIRAILHLVKRRPFSPDEEARIIAELTLNKSGRPHDPLKAEDDAARRSFYEAVTTYCAENELRGPSGRLEAARALWPDFQSLPSGRQLSKTRAETIALKGFSA